MFIKGSPTWNLFLKEIRFSRELDVNFTPLWQVGTYVPLLHNIVLFAYRLVRQRFPVIPLYMSNNLHSVISESQLPDCHADGYFYFGRLGLYVIQSATS